jgi:signal transduction histidine kinase
MRADLVDGLAGRRWYGVAMDIETPRRRAFEGVKPGALKLDALVGLRACSVTLDRAWRVMSMTPEAAAWVGVSEAQLLGVDCRERFPIPTALVEAVEASLAAGAAFELEIPEPTRADASVGFQIHPCAAGVSIDFWEIIGKRSADYSLRLATQGARSVLDASTSEMALLDPKGLIVSANAAWRESVESFRAGDTNHGIGSSFLEFCKSSIPDLDEAALRAGLSEVLGGQRADYAQPYVIAAPGGLRWRRLRIVAFRVGPSAQAVAVREDITDVGQAWAALRNTSEELLSALAHERERIAFELHDSTSQHLAALGLGLIRLKRLVGDVAGDLIADMSKSVEETVREIRVLSYLMKPSGLDRDDLEDAARLFVNGFGARTGLQTELRTEGDFRAISDTVQSAAFRVLQEALSNVYKHAHASRVEVDIANFGGALRVRIKDDGRGIAHLRDGRSRIAPGVGLASMETRVAQLGGTLDISCGDVGTIVDAIIPLAGGNLLLGRDDREPGRLPSEAVRR